MSISSEVALVISDGNLESIDGNQFKNFKSKFSLNGWYFFKDYSEKNKKLGFIHLEQEPKAGIVRLITSHLFEGIGTETANKVLSKGS